MKRPTACVECGRQVHGTVTHGCKACGRPLCSRCLALGLGIEVKLGIYRCHRCRRRARILRVALPILALIALAAMAYGLTKVVAAHRAAQRENRALAMEVAILRHELEAARDQLAEIPELRFVALAFEANFPRFYGTTRTAWQFSQRHELSPNLVLAVAYQNLQQERTK